jgi:hypothetical protein
MHHMASTMEMDNMVRTKQKDAPCIDIEHPSMQSSTMMMTRVSKNEVKAKDVPLYREPSWKWAAKIIVIFYFDGGWTWRTMTHIGKGCSMGSLAKRDFYFANFQ